MVDRPSALPKVNPRSSTRGRPPTGRTTKPLLPQKLPRWQRGDHKTRRSLEGRSVDYNLNRSAKSMHYYDYWSPALVLELIGLGQILFFRSYHSKFLYYCFFHCMPVSGCWRHFCIYIFIHQTHGSNNNKETKTNTTKDNYINIANSNLTI